MSDSEPPSHGEPSERRESLGAPELITRVQRLIDTPRPPGGYPLAWHVEALHLGDMTALAAAALRTR